MTNQTDQIGALNDDLRRHLSRTSEMAFMSQASLPLARSRRPDRQPVSTRVPRANREEQGILRDTSFSSGRDSANNCVAAGLPVRIPYSMEQGIILAKQGLCSARTGNFIGSLGDVRCYSDKWTNARAIGSSAECQ